MTALTTCPPDVTTVPTVAVRDVHKSYGAGDGRTVVLRGVDLDVFAGECLFLVGPSGSGKSTLLSILGCILEPDCGSVQMLGRELAELTPNGRAELRRDHLGFVFQRFHLIRGLSVLENVCLPLTFRNQTTSRVEQRAVELLTEVGLEQHLACDPRQMSSGQCQRVALARALAGDPQVVLADEPTASLDGTSGHQAMQLLRKLTVDRGRTAIVVTHDDRIFKYADRVLRMENGQIVQATCTQAGETSCSDSR